MVRFTASESNGTAALYTGCMTRMNGEWGQGRLQGALSLNLSHAL